MRHNISSDVYLKFFFKMARGFISPALKIMQDANQLSQFDFFLLVRISQPIPQPITNANTITVINNHSGGKDKSSFMLVVLGNYGLNS